jgi:hypothetical protein
VSTLGKILSGVVVGAIADHVLGNRRNETWLGDKHGRSG